MQSIEGIVTIVQEGRFQLLDRAGVCHMFLLSYKAAIEPEQLPPLQHEQARVCVEYEAGQDIIGLLARGITRLE